MRILERHPIDISPLKELERLSGIAIPDPLEAIREIDLDVDKIRAEVAQFRGVADELEGLIEELSGAQQQLAPGAGAWDSQAAAAASGVGETILTILKWILAIILIIVAVVLLIVDTILFVVLGVLKIVTAAVDYGAAVLTSLEALEKLVDPGPVRKLIRKTVNLLRGTVVEVIEWIAALIGVILPLFEKIVQGVRWLVWQLLLFAAQLVDKPKAEKVARKERDRAFEPILEEP